MEMGLVGGGGGAVEAPVVPIRQLLDALNTPQVVQVFFVNFAR